ncbi:mucin-2-like [Heptranchias perlo]|uniref:mucin-2-like n=1 Tax=Heptranchias perlo TaxID=212740 RepID=UPI003559FA55
MRYYTTPDSMNFELPATYHDISGQPVLPALPRGCTENEEVRNGACSAHVISSLHLLKVQVHILNGTCTVPREEGKMAGGWRDRKAGDSPDCSSRRHWEAVAQEENARSMAPCTWVQCRKKFNYLSQVVKCLKTYEEFNIQMRRTIVDGLPRITQIVIKIDGSVVEVLHSTISVDDNVVTLPYTYSGIMIEKVSSYTRVTAKIGLTLMWNGNDALTLELDQQFINTTCGLCGDFNGIRDNEIFSNGYHLTPIQYGNLNKLNGPMEQCKDVPSSESVENCSEFSSPAGKDTTASPAQATSRRGLIVASEPILHIWRRTLLVSSGCPCCLLVKIKDCRKGAGKVTVAVTFSASGSFQSASSDISNISQFAVHMTIRQVTGALFARLQQFISFIMEAGKQEERALGFAVHCWILAVQGITECMHDCKNTLFTVLGELQPRGIAESETALKSVVLAIHGAQTIISINSGGTVSVNGILTQLPVTTANVTIFKPSTFHVIFHTTFGLQLQVQLVPIMQLYITLDPAVKSQMCGLCGNFNDVLNDEFKTVSGLVEGTPSAFANTWKTKASCPDRKDIYENPCSLSVENEKYAKHWCSLLVAENSAFALCHSQINPNLYYEQCKYDSCNCEKSEDCMCAALSSYVQACAAKGITISNWRTDVCSKYINCPKTLIYSSNMTNCHRTCQSLGAPDKTCEVDFVPVDGCGCANGTYMDGTGKCVPPSSCSCYYKGSAVAAGAVIHEEDAMCACNQGKLECIGKDLKLQACVAPMVYFDCNNASVGSAGTECQKSCQTLDMDCYATDCVSGCVCPEGLVSDESGGCIPINQCPCAHNGVHYQSGDIVQVDCNTCECNNRLWTCTKQQCHGTCMIYGDGHYITFDGKRYNFNGDCEYIVAQDYCGNNPSIGTFRVITENIPCGTTGTTCSKSIKIFLGNSEIKLSDGKYEVVKFGSSIYIPYEVRHLGIYLVIEAKNGLVLMWDKKTSLTIKLSHSFKGTICGLCGNYDGNVHNDFTTKSQLVVVNMEEFGNSWKMSPTCPNVKKGKDPCSINVHRDAWAQKQCSIIKSEPFQACNSQVNPAPYYEACVRDACACDTGGDCECFCTAVAAYSLACSMVGVCISWRNPEVCPLFCDYYNPNDECEWHYAPCGIPCMKTCQNPGGACSKIIPKLEGCYPDCPDDKPFLDEESMQCVALDHCSCHINGKHYEPGQTVPSTQNCESCKCINSEAHCIYDKSECTCVYDGKTFHEGDVIYHTMDGIGGCIKATCGVNGTISRKVYPCTPKTSTVPSTTLAFETTIATTTSSTSISTTTESTTKQSKITLTSSSPTTAVTATTSSSTETVSLTATTTLETSKAATTPSITLSTTTATTTEVTSERSQPTSTTPSPITTVTPTTSIPTKTVPVTATTTTSSTSTAAATKTTSEQSQTTSTTFSPTTVSSTTTIPTKTVPVTATTTAETTPLKTSTVTTTPSSILSTTTATTTEVQSEQSQTTPAAPSPTSGTRETFTINWFTNPSKPTSITDTTTAEAESVKTSKATTTPKRILSTTTAATTETASDRSQTTSGTRVPFTINWFTNPSKPTSITDTTTTETTSVQTSVCAGWGGSHYLTFDGTDYTFQGNCTYILVKQIKEVIKGFKIYIDNYFCDVQKDLSCPKAIIVFYKSSVITLIQMTVNSTVKTKILKAEQECTQAVRPIYCGLTSFGTSAKQKPRKTWSELS